MEGNFPQAGPARYEVLVPAPLCRREDASRRRVARWMTPEMRTNARSELGLLMGRAGGEGGRPCQVGLFGGGCTSRSGQGERCEKKRGGRTQDQAQDMDERTYTQQSTLSSPGLRLRAHCVCWYWNRSLRHTLRRVSLINHIHEVSLFLTR